MKNKIIFEENHTEWCNKFKDEALKIAEITCCDLKNIYHIGSSSIFGLISKPTIDILLISDDINIFNKLANAGYQYKPNIKIRSKFFSKKNPFDFHLHLFNSYDDDVFRIIKFRDHLRSSLFDKIRYADLKRELSNDLSSYEIDEKTGTSRYAQMKDDFITEIVKKYKN